MGKQQLRFGQLVKWLQKVTKRRKQNLIHNLGGKRINQVICFHISFPPNCEQFAVK